MVPVGGRVAARAGERGNAVGSEQMTEERLASVLSGTEAVELVQKLATFRRGLSEGEMVVFDRVVWAAAGRPAEPEVAGYDDGGYNPITFLIRAFTGTSGSGTGYPYSDVPIDWPNHQSALFLSDDDPILQ